MKIIERIAMFCVGGAVICGAGFVAWFLISEALRPNDAPVIPQEDGQEELKNITVATPVANELIGLPVAITGQARVFENAFAYRILDSAGNVLVLGHAMANAPDMGVFGPFSVETNYAAPQTPTGFVEVFSYSAKDGAEENLVRVPVGFAPVASKDIAIFFATSEGMQTDCTQVTSVSRRVANVPAIASEALHELLQGPSFDEYAQGLTSLIPPGTELRSLIIDEGIATVTFREHAFAGVAGSCMVSAIRAQITQTLLQFPSVTQVDIRIEGVPEGEELQP